MNHSTFLHRAFSVLFFSAVISVSILDLLPDTSIPQEVMFWDKGQHALAYTVLGLLGFLAYPRHRTWIIAGLLLHGAVMEIAQSTLTTTRMGDPFDWIADLVGILIALAFYLAASGQWRRMFRVPV